MNVAKPLDGSDAQRVGLKKSAQSSTGYLTKYNGVDAQSDRSFLHFDVNKAKGKCRLHLHKRSMSHFRHVVYYGDLSFVKLHLKMTPRLSLKPSRDIVGVGHWVWTYYGQHGGLEFLEWPLEFQIWSLGLLNAYVGDHFDMNITKKVAIVPVWKLENMTRTLRSVKR